jgi:membrane glycosyltransferase
MGLLGFAPTATDILILVGIYAVAQIALVLLAITYCSRARMASLLIGWFCLVYGALPVYYLTIALSSI